MTSHDVDVIAMTLISIAILLFFELIVLSGIAASLRDLVRRVKRHL